MNFDLLILVFGIFGYQLLNISIHYSGHTVNDWLKSIAKKMATTNPSPISQEAKNYYEKALNKILAMKDLHPAQEILAKKLLKSLQKLSEQQIDQEQSTLFD